MINRTGSICSESGIKGSDSIDFNRLGFDPSILQNAQAQQKLEAHIATLNNPTVGDVIGGKKTIIKAYPMLPSSVPNRIVVIGTRYDKLPSALQQKIKFSFGGTPLSFPYAKLNNEKVNLSFKPATKPMKML